MSEARTIPWETISGWFAKNEQQIRDVMKFEGLRGAVNEVLRLAPDQPELDAQRLRADTAEAELRTEKLRADAAVGDANEAEQKLAAAEQRIAGLKAVLERMLEDDDMPVHWFAQRIDAALNQKSEGESQ